MRNSMHTYTTINIKFIGLLNMFPVFTYFHKIYLEELMKTATHQMIKMSLHVNSYCSS